MQHTEMEGELMSMDTRIMRMGTLLLDLGDLDEGREVAVVSGGGSEL